MRAGLLIDPRLLLRPLTGLLICIVLVVATAACAGHSKGSIFRSSMRIRDCRHSGPHANVAVGKNVELWPSAKTQFAAPPG